MNWTRSMRAGIALISLGAASLASAVAGIPGAGEGETGREFFEGKVRPLLEAHCVQCHGPGKQKAGLRVDSRGAMLRGGDSGPALEPGKPSTSRLIEVLQHNGDVAMPPRRKLVDGEIDILTRWVRAGADWPDSPVSAATEASGGASGPRPLTAEERAFWAFRPVEDRPAPAVADAAWPHATLDRFILAGLESRGIRPAARADRRTLIRRATFDLTGLPPTPEEVDAFLADAADGAFERVVDRLLASPHFGERWARHWLDVARYGEDQAHDFEPRLYPQGYKYRDWVIRAFNADMPYDRFVTAQIAGDLVARPGPPDAADDRAATGLFALGPVYYGGAVLDEYDDRVDTLTRGFLGLTVACARCHDHKFDPITQHDYYALAGIFASSAYKEYPQVPAAEVARHDAAQAKIKELTATIRGRRKDAEKEGATTDAVTAAKAAVRELQAELDRAKKEAPPKFPVIHGLAEGPKVANMRVHLRGNPATLGADAPRGFLAILARDELRPTPFAVEGSGRLELARAIASPENPLTARVMVNRVWEKLFGVGIVATPSNFGRMGDRPSHPELLDHLAARFVASGWSTKTLIREILGSSTYQLAATDDPRAREVDPANALHWRANRRRLEVEAWRDAILAASGTIDPAIGGTSGALAAPENRRRTLYASVSRHNLDGLLRLFDFPDPNITSDRRSVTTVPLQQLFVLNSPFMHRQARALAERLAVEAPFRDEDRVRRAFALLLGRAPTEPEIGLALDYLAGLDESGTPSRWERYAQILLATNEFLYID